MENSNQPPLSAADRVGVIDLIGHDKNTDEAVLVMHEPDPWNGSEERLHFLQERFNAYASFLLDGECGEMHPELAGKKARIEVRCAYVPDQRAIELLGLIHDQLEFQDIKMEVLIPGGEGEGDCCGGGCSCEH